MTVKLRVKRPDSLLRKIVEALEAYAAAHPTTEIDPSDKGNDGVNELICIP